MGGVLRALGLHTLGNSGLGRLELLGGAEHRELGAGDRRRGVPGRHVEGISGLTAREVEVLRLVACGLSNKEIAKRLVISPKTTGDHIEHIYTKIGATNRAAAGLFAMQHGLMPEEGFPVGE